MPESIPNWMKKFSGLVLDTIDGNMINYIYLFSPDGGWVMDVHPSLLRVKNSEELVWSSFSADLKRILGIVDGGVEELQLFEDGVVVKATFTGHPFTLRLRNEPRDDAEIEGLVTEDGAITPYRSTETGVSSDKDLN